MAHVGALVTVLASPRSLPELGTCHVSRPNTTAHMMAVVKAIARQLHATWLHCSAVRARNLVFGSIPSITSLGFIHLTVITAAAGAGRQRASLAARIRTVTTALASISGLPEFGAGHVHRASATTHLMAILEPIALGS